jgi:hypothetical protein
MSATIEKSLYIGFLKTRFDMFDRVTLILEDGKEVSGEIVDLEDGFVSLQTDDMVVDIRVGRIVDYKP